VAGRLRLQADLIVDGASQPLFTAQVSLCRFDRHVPEKELDLLHFAASSMTESSACGARPYTLPLFALHLSSRVLSLAAWSDTALP
jgi:hypothetical protein